MRSYKVAVAGRRAIAWLRSAEAPRVLHVFPKVCNLVDLHGQVLSLANPEIHLGPFTARLATRVDFRRRVSRESRIRVTAEGVQLGREVISFSWAESWNPCPAWRGIRPACQSARWPELERLARRAIPASALAGYRLADGFGRSQGVTQAVALRLTGLGPGLTPTGDDFLVGAIHALWALLPADLARRAGAWICSTARGRTTALSCAWLAAAARGEAAAPWHTLTEALAPGSRMPLGVAVGELLAIGHSSGADGMAGFLAVIRAEAR